MCLITNNIVKNGDIWLEIVNYSKNLVFWSRSSTTAFFSRYTRMWEKQIFNQKDKALENNW